MGGAFPAVKVIVAGAMLKLAGKLVPETLASKVKTSFFTSVFFESLETSHVVSMIKLGPTAAAESTKRKNVDGQMPIASRNAKGRPRITPYNPPSEP